MEYGSITHPIGFGQREERTGAARGGPLARPSRSRPGHRVGATLALWLYAAACREVRVVSAADGRPVENAGIRVMTARDTKVAGRTDADGVRWVSLPDSGEGAVTFLVCRWLFAPAKVSFPSSAGVPRPLIIRLRPDSTNTAGDEARRRCGVTD
jgi:hypothetical protein